MYRQRSVGSTYEPTPAATLDARSRSVELLLEVVEAAERCDDGVHERAVLQRDAAPLAPRRCACKVLPAERVVDVAFAQDGQQPMGDRNGLSKPISPITYLTITQNLMSVESCGI